MWWGLSAINATCAHIIKCYHSSHGYALNLSAFLRLQLILRGIKRSQGVNSRARRPITLPILNLFYHLLNVKYTINEDSLMVWAAMTLAFFGFLRIGELTCDSHFNPKRHLTISDLVFMPKSSPKYMLVQLKVSKTDPFRKGQTIVIGRANSNLCPISAMVTYLESCSQPRALTYFSIWFLSYSGQIYKWDQAFTFKGRTWFKRICRSQFSHRCSYHSCFSQLTPLAH